MPEPMTSTIRTALQTDIPALCKLIAQSIRGLQATHYTPAQMDGAIGNALGLDTQLVADGTYFLAESPGVQHPVACGGWSFRRTLFGSDGAQVRECTHLNPGTDPAKIRAIFVHPAFARRGLGTLLLTHAEQAAAASGFRAFELGSTLTGVPLYTLRGYTPVEHLTIPLPNGESLPMLRMKKAHP